MPRIILLLVLAGLCAVYLLGAPEPFDYGRVEHCAYTNRFFKLPLPVPRGWQVQTKEQQAGIVKAGEQLMTGDNLEKKARQQAAQARMANLLLMFQFAEDSTDGYNPNLALMAENLSAAPTIKSSQDYLLNLRQALASSQAAFTFGPAFRPVRLGQRQFYSLDVATEIAGTKVEQVYYVTLINGYALVLATGFSGREQEQMMQQLVQQAHFE
jgi:hypothetical protein